MSPREKEYTERINVFFSKEQMEQVKAEAAEKAKEAEKKAAEAHASMNDTVSENN